MTPTIMIMMTHTTPVPIPSDEPSLPENAAAKRQFLSQPDVYLVNRHAPWSGSYCGSPTKPK